MRPAVLTLLGALLLAAPAPAAARDCSKHRPYAQFAEIVDMYAYGTSCGSARSVVRRYHELDRDTRQQRRHVGSYRCEFTAAGRVAASFRCLGPGARRITWSVDIAG